MEYLSLENGFKLAYEISGNPDGPKMVLIHGLFLNSDCWREQLSYFEDDFHILRFDLRGHGRTTKPEEQFTIKNYVKDMHALLEHLDWNNNLYLVGHSLGAMISLVYGILYPDEVGKILCGSGFCYVSLEAETDVLGRIDAYPLENFAMGISKRGLTPYDEETAKFVAKQVTDHLTKEQCLRANAASAGFNICEYLKDLEVPVLCVVGENDITTPMWASEMLNDWLANAKTIVIPEAGHLTILDHPDEFNRLTEEFWKKE